MDGADAWRLTAVVGPQIIILTSDLEKDRVAFEFKEIIALSAPLPMFMHAAQGDHLFPHRQSVGACLLDVHQLYGWMKADDRFVYYLGAGDHNFPPAMRLAAYDFLDQWLMNGKQR